MASCCKVSGQAVPSILYVTTAAALLSRQSCSSLDPLYMTAAASQSMQSRKDRGLAILDDTYRERFVDVKLPPTLVCCPILDDVRVAEGEPQ